MARAYAAYSRKVVATPQSHPIPGREAEMTPNNAGGFGFVLNDWDRLMRFLILGSDAGTYYVSEQKLTKQNGDVAIRCIKADGPRAVAMARDVNVNNRAPKTDPQLFVLALALEHGDSATKSMACDAARDMLRTGTHVLHFASIVDSMGWNRTKKYPFKQWFRGNVDNVAYQILKYQDRDGMSMRRLLGVTHPRGGDPEKGGEYAKRNALFKWVREKNRETLSSRTMTELPKIIADRHIMLATETDPVKQALWGIEHNLPREALPTEALSNGKVQEAMLPTMPVHAMIRNLGNLTASGLLSDARMVKLVTDKLTDGTILRRARVHPFAVLLAALIYKGGTGIRGGKTWNPHAGVLAALEDAYDLAFASVTPTGKRMIVGIDISLSMSKPCVGSPIPASMAAAAMAVTIARLEPNATVIQFDTRFQRRMTITKRTGITSLMNVSGGGTNLAAPMEWAANEKIDTDAFVILTDDETWAGKIHPSQAFARYRRERNKAVKLVCCSMAASHANIVDGTDPLQFGTAGLDAHVPVLVSDFIGR